MRKLLFHFWCISIHVVSILIYDFLCGEILFLISDDNAQVFPTYKSIQKNSKVKTKDEEGTYTRKCSIEVLLQLYVDSIFIMHQLYSKNLHILNDYKGDNDKLLTGKRNQPYAFTFNKNGGFGSEYRSSMSELKSIIPTSYKFSYFVQAVLFDHRNTNQIPAWAKWYKKHDPTAKNKGKGKKGSGDKDEDYEDDDDDDTPKTPVNTRVRSQGKWLADNIKSLCGPTEDSSNDENAARFLPLLFKEGVITNITFDKAVLKHLYAGHHTEKDWKDLFELAQPLNGGWSSPNTIKKKKDNAKMDIDTTLGPAMGTPPRETTGTERTESPLEESNVSSHTRLTSSNVSSQAKVLTIDDSDVDVRSQLESVFDRQVKKQTEQEKSKKRKANERGARKSRKKHDTESAPP